MTPRLLWMAALVLAAHLTPTKAAVRVWGIEASGLQGDPTTPPDPYVKVSCGTTSGGMTEFYRDTHNPSWQAEFNFPNCNANNILKLEVWDKDLNFDDNLGSCITYVRRSRNFRSCYMDPGTLTFFYELQ